MTQQMNRVELCFDEYSFSRYLDFVATARKVYADNPNMMQRVEKFDYILSELSRVKCYSDTGEEYLSLQFYPRELEFFVNFILRICVLPGVRAKEADEYRSYIERIKLEHPERIWKEWNRTSDKTDR